jgi:peroxiredoxin/uncharacterized membrane protein YphA (DoxX/SURF4 family)
MASIALGVRVLLAIVFATAAAGKLADRPGARRALADFGMPARLVNPVALLLPAAELAAAVALVVQQSARWGAVAALGLLIVFVVGIAKAMARGEAPDCHCFGQLSSAPAGRGTLIRNGILALPAVLVVAYGPGEAIDSWVSARSAAELVAVAAGVLALALGAFCLRLWLENRDLRRGLATARESLAAFPAGLPIGAPAPGFALPTVDGQTTTLDDLRGRGKPVALVFVSPTCAPCVSMLPDLARWQTTLADRLTIALLAAGDVREIRRVSEQHGLTNVLVQDDAEVFEAYRAAASPSVVIVTTEGRIGSDTRSSQAIVEAVIRRSLRGGTLVPTPRPAPANGERFEVREWSGTGSPA